MARLIDGWEESQAARGAQLAEMLSLPPDERPTFHLSCDQYQTALLDSWGFIVIHISPSAPFTEANAAVFKDCGVVIWPDYSPLGLQFSSYVAPLLRHAGARVQVAALQNYWPDINEGDNLYDWSERGGGSAEKLYGILEDMPEWQPPEYRSQFGAVRWREITASSKPYRWLIKGICPFGQSMLIFGPTGCGKSFFTIDMAAHVAQGKTYHGRKVERCGVAYCFYEAQDGAPLRVRAYQKFYGLEAADLPFLTLCHPPQLYENESAIQKLTEETLHYADEWEAPLGLIVVDTHNAATRGAGEIDSKEISIILKRYDLLRQATGAGLAIVGHSNQSGRHRGNEQVVNNFETSILIMPEEGANKDDRRDDDGRIVRHAVVKKQREGLTGLNWRFVLREVEIGRDPDGDQITSCVPIQPHFGDEQESMSAPERKRTPAVGGGFHLRTSNQLRLFQALIRAVDDHGISPPLSLQLPQSIPKVVRWERVAEAYRATVPRDEGEEVRAYLDRMKKRTRDARDVMVSSRVVGVGEVKGADGQTFHVLWPTGRRVVGAGFSWPPGPSLVADGGELLEPSPAAAPAAAETTTTEARNGDNSNPYF
jgi:AAA domain